MVAKFLKDSFCKYKTMQGYKVLRKVGEPELRELCSQDAPVRDFILHNEQSRTVLNYALSMLLLQADLYAERGWGNDMTVGVGCKGGRHRSVVGAEFLAAGLREHGHTVTVFHRDLSREGNA